MPNSKLSIPEQLRRENIQIDKATKRRIRSAIRTLRFREKVLDRLIKNTASAGYKDGHWVDREALAKVREYSVIRGNIRNRIYSLGGGRRGIDRAGDLYH